MRLRHLIGGGSSLAFLAAGVIAQQPAATLDTITVTAEAPIPYTVPDTTGALKTDAPILTTPQSVSVITQESIRDRGVRRLDEAVQNTAGVTLGGVHPSFDVIKLRGYESWDTYLDGLREDVPFGSTVWGLEKVEVLKGPSSSLYGQSNLGGVVNKVSKRPRANDFFGEVMVGAGSWDLFESGIDLNVPLITAQPAAPVQSSGKDAKNVQGKGVAPVVATESFNGQTLTARFNAYYRDGGLFYRGSHFEQLYLAGALLWEIGPDTSLTILANYYDSKQSFMWAFPAEGTIWNNPNGEIDVRNYPANTNGYNLGEGEMTNIGYEFKHGFSDAVSLRQNARVSWSNFYRNGFEYPGGLTDDLRSVYVYPPYYAQDDDFIVSIDTALDFKFQTGAVNHTFTTGFDFTYLENEWASGGPEDAEQTYDLFSGRKQTFKWSARGPLTSSPNTVTENYGIYLQDRLTFLDGKLALIVGGRYDISQYDDGYGNYEESAFTGRAGISYEVAPGIAPYVSYARSFYPQWYSTDASGAPVEPEEGEQWEAGIKTSLLDGRLNTTVSVFQLTRENVATEDLTTPDPFDSIVSGEQEVRGAEFETIAQLAPGLNLTLAYTYLHSEITEDNVIPVGGRIQGVPDHTASAWLKYTFQEGFLKGFGVGLGGRYVSSQAGDINASFDLPSYAVMDAAIYYERENFTIQVNFNNVTDERYFSGSSDNTWIYPGAPFNVNAQVSWKF